MKLYIKPNIEVMLVIPHAINAASLQITEEEEADPNLPSEVKVNIFFNEDIDWDKY